MAQTEGAGESESRSSELRLLNLHEQVGQELGSEPSSKKGWNGRWLRLPGCWNIPGADVVQQLQFLGGPCWWAGVPLRGESDLKNCWDSYSSGSAAWPYTGLPVQERSFGTFRSEDWPGLCSFITCMGLQCLLGREVIGMGVWSMIDGAQRAVLCATPSPGWQALECHRFV